MCRVKKLWATCSMGKAMTTEVTSAIPKKRRTLRFGGSIGTVILE
jgi:hypothetical protein